MQQFVQQYTIFYTDVCIRVHHFHMRAICTESTITSAVSEDFIHLFILLDHHCTLNIGLLESDNEEVIILLFMKSSA